MNIRDKWICLYLFHDWFPLEFVFIYSIFLMYKYLLEIIKRRSKVQEEIMPCEPALNFDEWITFFENYKPIEVCLWLVYKFTENCCLDKISVLAWKLLVI